jgi:hypothetical protein
VGTSVNFSLRRGRGEKNDKEGKKINNKCVLCFVFCVCVCGWRMWWGGEDSNEGLNMHASFLFQLS